MKKLNNQGFTLIELLAVVVILAVVMGIAMTSVFSAMDKARGGALTDSSIVIADAFTKKYTESLVDGAPTKVYGTANFTGYNFSTSAVYYLDESLDKEFDISKNVYKLTNAESGTGDNKAYVAVPTELTTDASGNVTGGYVENSFVSYASGQFVVCLIANEGGNNYVADMALEDNAVLTFGEGDDAVTFNLKKGTMYSCSNEKKSW